MVNETNLIVRVSGRKASSFYIDYSGMYKAADIAKATGISAPDIKEIYVANGAAYDEGLEVYYFGNRESADKAVSEILGKTGAALKGKAVFLTESEVEYIRKALINEQSNTIHVKNKIKDAIFKKLNA